MSDRPYSPLEGDPDDLIAMAQHYQEIGNAIARSANTLKAIGDRDAMTSQAVDALRDSAKAVGDDIDKARERYQQTASALLTYGDALRTAQADARAAISLITTREQDANSAHRAALHANTELHDATDDTRQDAQQAATRAGASAQEADALLRAAQQQWETARDDKNRAAAAAIETIVGVVERNNQGLQDGWWDDWGAALYGILKTICDWAGILAIFLSWVPILGQILLVLAAVGAVLSLIESIVKVINGDGSWGDVALAAIGAVLAVGGGKLISLAAKGAKGMVVTKAAGLMRAEGKNVRVEMKALQNAKWGSSAYMSQSAAKAAVKSGREAFDTFAHGRSTLVKAFKDTFTADVKSVADKGLKSFVDGKVYDLKNGLVFGSNLNQSMSIIKAYPELLKDPAVVKAMMGATSLQIGKVGTDIIRSWDSAMHADDARVEAGNLHDPVRVWSDGAVGTAKALGVTPASAIYKVGTTVAGSLG